MFETGAIFLSNSFITAKQAKKAAPAQTAATAVLWNKLLAATAPKIANKQGTKKPDYSSWLFAIADDKSELQKYIDEGKNLLLALVCGSSELDKSQLAILDKSQIQDILSREKTSITISRIKGEKAFRISVGGGRENSIQVKCNRFEELFWREMKCNYHFHKNTDFSPPKGGDRNG